MAVGFFVDPVFYSVGTGDFLNSFFSTIYVKLEDLDWGSRYPVLMHELYNGRVENNKVGELKIELEKLSVDLSRLAPSEIVWDFEDLKAEPPWGSNISEDIINMADYFVTSEGENLLDVLERACNACLKIDEDLAIKSL